jgi:hypothetical protein
MKPKPYTLEWWLVQFRVAIVQADVAVFVGIPDNDMRSKYMHLAVWIHDRIVRKYGERPE